MGASDFCVDDILEFAAVLAAVAAGRHDYPAVRRFRNKNCGLC